MLQQAIAAARTGRKAEARQLLQRVLQTNPRHEQAWLWMGAVVETDAERVKCLQQVLAINPDNAAARKGLDQLQARAGAIPAATQAASPSPMEPLRSAWTAPVAPDAPCSPVTEAPKM